MLILNSFVLAAAGGGPATFQPVVWTDLVNVSDSSGNLTKTGGSGGSWDAGAFGVAPITGNFELKFVVPATVHNIMWGISASNPDASFSTIAVAIAVFAGGAGVFKYVSGSGTSLTGTYPTGTVLELRRVGTSVQPYLNGSTIGSPDTLAGTVFVDVSISSASGVINGLLLKNG